MVYRRAYLGYDGLSILQFVELDLCGVTCLIPLRTARHRLRPLVQTEYSPGPLYGLIKLIYYINSLPN